MVKNNEKTIQESIKSVLSQNYTELEYLVIDGQSTDATFDKINKFRNKIQYAISEPDQGIYHALNKGIKQASGEIIGILNSDDIYTDPYVLAEVASQFSKDPELDILYADLVYVANNDTSRIIRKWKSKAYYPNFFEHGNVPAHPTLFLRRKVYELAGLFETKYTLAADYEFMLRIFKKFNFKSKYLSRLMVKMRLGGVTNASFKNVYRGNLEIIDAWRTNEFSMPTLLMPKRFFRRLAQYI